MKKKEYKYRVFLKKQQLESIDFIMKDKVKFDNQFCTEEAYTAFTLTDGVIILIRKDKLEEVRE